jgi:1,6-anhydro-N-acetylmuramate kinase
MVGVVGLHLLPTTLLPDKLVSTYNVRAGEASAMGSDITTKIITAIAATLVAELTDKVLDCIGLTEAVARLPREIIKAVAFAVAAFLTEEILSDSDIAALGMPARSEIHSILTGEPVVDTPRAA